MGKVIRVDFKREMVQIKRRPRRCEHTHTIADETEGVVYCASCKKTLDPVKVLVSFVKNVLPMLEKLRELAISEGLNVKPINRPQRRARRYTK
jgi:hypothetical protein